MNILYLNDIDYSKVKKQFNKTVEFLENNNFISAEIKKMPGSGFYRAKLDYENQLLFKLRSGKRSRKRKNDVKPMNLNINCRFSPG